MKLMKKLLMVAMIVQTNIFAPLIEARKEILTEQLKVLETQLEIALTCNPVLKAKEAADSKAREELQSISEKFFEQGVQYAQEHEKSIASLGVSVISMHFLVRHAKKFSECLKEYTEAKEKERVASESFIAIYEALAETPEIKTLLARKSQLESELKA